MIPPLAPAIVVICVVAAAAVVIPPERIEGKRLVCRMSRPPPTPRPVVVAPVILAGHAVLQSSELAVVLLLLGAVRPGGGRRSGVRAAAGPVVLSGVDPGVQPRLPVERLPEQLRSAQQPEEVDVAVKAARGGGVGDNGVVMVKEGVLVPT